MRKARSSKIQENPGFTGGNGVLAVPKVRCEEVVCRMQRGENFSACYNGFSSKIRKSFLQASENYKY